MRDSIEQIYRNATLLTRIYTSYEEKRSYSHQDIRLFHVDEFWRMFLLGVIRCVVRKGQESVFVI